MDHRKLRRRLKVLARRANEQFPALNHGGCCVFAAAVATELENHGVRHEVISMGNSHMNLNELRPESNTVDAWNSMGVGFGHMGVRLRLKGQWFTYDSENPLLPGKHLFGKLQWSERPYMAARGGLTAAEATELANEANSWNRTFRRGDVPLVRALVQQLLND